MIDPLNNAIKMSYDDPGRPIEIKDAKGKSAFYSYDAASRVTGVTDANGNATGVFLYRFRETLPCDRCEGEHTRYEYDDRDRITKVTDPLGRYETYTYYRDSEITSTTGDNLKTLRTGKGR